MSSQHKRVWGDRIYLNHMKRGPFIVNFQSRHKQKLSISWSPNWPLSKSAVRQSSQFCRGKLVLSTMFGRTFCLSIKKQRATIWSRKQNTTIRLAINSKRRWSARVGWCVIITDSWRRATETLILHARQHQICTFGKSGSMSTRYDCCPQSVMEKSFQWQHSHLHISQAEGHEHPLGLFPQLLVYTGWAAGSVKQVTLVGGSRACLQHMHLHIVLYWTLNRRERTSYLHRNMFLLNCVCTRICVNMHLVLVQLSCIVIASRRFGLVTIHFLHLIRSTWMSRIFLLHNLTSS